jgi:hypothetical protein
MDRAITQRQTERRDTVVVSRAAESIGCSSCSRYTGICCVLDQLYIIRVSRSLCAT